METNEYTTLKIRKSNINRLFKLKQVPDDTYDDVIARLLDEKEKQKAWQNLTLRPRSSI